MAAFMARAELCLPQLLPSLAGPVECNSRVDDANSCSLPSAPSCADLAAGTMGARMTCSPRIHILSRGPGASMVVLALDPLRPVPSIPNQFPHAADPYPPLPSWLLSVVACVRSWRRRPALC